MIDRSAAYDNKILHDAEGSCYAILNLARMGIAAGDTTMAIDPKKGGFDTLFEMIAALAADAIEHLETPAKGANQ